MTRRTEALLASKKRETSMREQKIAVVRADLSDLSELSNDEPKKQLELIAYDDDDSDWDQVLPGKTRVNESDAFVEGEDDSSGSEYGVTRKPTVKNKADRELQKRLAAIKGPRRGYHCFDGISHEILSMILFDLDDHDITALSATCSRFHNFSKAGSVAAGWLAGHYPATECLWRLIGRPGICTPEAIDAVIARGPKLSRYLVQILCQAKVKQAPAWTGRKWGLNLSFPSFVHILSIANGLFGMHVDCVKGKTDDCIFEGWVASGGREDKPRKLQQQPRHRSAPMAVTPGPAADDKETQKQLLVTFSAIKELFTDYNFSIFCPDDPILSRFGPAFALQPEILQIAVKAGFTIDYAFKQNAINRALFDSSKSVADRVTNIKDLIKAGVTFESDHLVILLSGSTHRRQTFVGCSQSFLDECSLQTRQALDSARVLDTSLWSVILYSYLQSPNGVSACASKVLRHCRPDEAVWNAANIELLAAAWPEAALSNQAMVNVTIASCVLVLPHDKLSSVLRATNSCSRAVRDRILQVSHTFTPQKMQERIDVMKSTASVDTFIKVCGHSIVDSTPFVRILFDDFKLDETQKRSLCQALFDKPLSGVMLGNLATFDDSCRAIIRSMLDESQLELSSTFRSAYTPLGISLSRTESVLLFLGRANANTAYYLHQSESVVVPKSDFFGDSRGASNGAAMLELFPDSFEVKQNVFEHALLCGNTRLVRKCLQLGACVTLQHFAWLRKNNVAPVQALLTALASRRFVAKKRHAVQLPPRRHLGHCSKTCAQKSVDRNAIHCCGKDTAISTQIWYHQLNKAFSHLSRETNLFDVALMNWLNCLKIAWPKIDELAQVLIAPVQKSS